ncbi:MAG: alpha/beta hydrolase [Alphaproteobacteria bacterium]
MRVIALAAALLLLANSAFAQAARVVDVPTRGTTVRALLLLPATPVGSVILLAGGHGRLDLAADVRIGWGSGNQLVRTRAAYAAAGYATLVPDIAEDLKTWDGVAQGYRFSAQHGRDLGALVAYMRAIRQPVVVVATSRGAVSAGVLLAEAAAPPTRPDGVVMTAPMLMSIGDRLPNFRMAIGDAPARARLPLLVVGNRRDTCRYTLPASIDAFVAWHGGAVDVVMLDGPQGVGDPCEARAAHGFAGIDGEVVATVTGWIGRRLGR